MEALEGESKRRRLGAPPEELAGASGMCPPVALSAAEIVQVAENLWPQMETEVLAAAAEQQGNRHMTIGKDVVMLSRLPSMICWSAPHRRLKQALQSGVCRKAVVVALQALSLTTQLGNTWRERLHQDYFLSFKEELSSVEIEVFCYVLASKLLVRNLTFSGNFFDVTFSLSLWEIHHVTAFFEGASEMEKRKVLPIARELLERTQGDAALRITDRWVVAEEMLQFLKENKFSALKAVSIATDTVSSTEFDGSKFRADIEGVRFLRAVSRSFSGLEELHISEGAAGNVMGDALMELLVPKDENTASWPVTAPPASRIFASLKLLSLGHRVEPHALQRMITFNRTFETLNLSGVKYSKLEWARKIVPALKKNTTLLKLILHSCPGISSDVVYRALIDMLHVNTTLTTIDLTNTALEKAGKAEAVEEELRHNREYRATLQGLPTMLVKSCRLVLCGYQFSGKTTLCETMLRVQSGAQRFQAGDASMVQGSQAERETDRRTRGFEVNVLLEEEDLRIAIWDFAGQKEYYALHDFVFPSANNSSIFLFAYSPLANRLDSSNPTDKDYLKDIDTLEDDFIYWLRFVTSNSKQVPSQPAKPSVVVVITFQDHPLVKRKMRKVDVRRVIRDLKKKFKDFVDLVSEPIFVDAHCDEDVRRIVTMVTKQFRELVPTLPQVPMICDKIRLGLEKWCTANNGKPVISLSEFQDEFAMVCADQIRDSSSSPDLSSSLDKFMKSGKGWKIVALYLHNTGEVIYFEDLDFMVVSPRWLGQGIIGQLIDAFGPSTTSSHRAHLQQNFSGRLSRETLQELLDESLSSVQLPTDVVTLDTLIQLMLKLHLCYKNEVPVSACEEEYITPVEEEYIAPVLFSNQQPVDRQQKWPSGIPDQPRHLFFGLRLQCSDLVHTFLTPGFFPRLQVVLQNRMEQAHNTCLKLEADLFGVSIQGLDVLIEYSDSTDYYVDVLVRTVRPYRAAMGFLQQDFIKVIRSFCASQEGCIGVSLVEGVLRRECVQQLTLCRYRRRESILQEDLRKLVLGHPRDEGDNYYIQQWEDIPNEDRARPPVLRANIEYAAVLGDYIVLGDKEDLAKAESSCAVAMNDECYAAGNLGQGLRRGVALLISMEKDRPGSAVDRGRLEVLAQQLGFLVAKEYILVNQNAAGLKGKIKEIADSESAISVGCEGFLCFVCAHGGTKDGGLLIFDDDENSVRLLEDIIMPFRKNPHLEGKPKVFFVNACRVVTEEASQENSGKEVHNHVQTPQEGEKVQACPLQTPEEQHEGEQVQVAPQGQCSEGKEFHNLQGGADCLLVFSTSELSLSWRYHISGSPFIKAVVEVLTEKRQQLDLLAMTRLFVERVRGMGNESKNFQCPVVMHSLTKLIYWRDELRRTPVPDN